MKENNGQRAAGTEAEDHKERNRRTDSEMLEWIWRWIDRMASGQVTTAEGLSVLTHSPDTPQWVMRRSSEPPEAPQAWMLGARITSVNPSNPYEPPDARPWVALYPRPKGMMPRWHFAIEEHHVETWLVLNGPEGASVAFYCQVGEGRSRILRKWAEDVGLPHAPWLTPRKKSGSNAEPVCADCEGAHATEDCTAELN